jgi:epoxyqueuosine reductase
MATAHELTEMLAHAALSRGLAWFGVAEADALPEDEARLRAWLAEGRHGTMAWLEKEPERRSDPRRVIEGCRSVVVLGLNYLREDAPPPDASLSVGIISKYARTRDYHRVFERELRALCRLLDEAAPGSQSRGLVDYGPALERAWAARAGLGFIGKNTMLIHPQQGSFHFLAVLLTTAELVPTKPVAPMTDCGACRRCIDACPTGAITEPWKLDARRCLSYLTIEETGPIDESFWPNYQGWLFGCDICQDVCPYNRTRAPIADADSPLGPQVVPAAWSLAEMIAITDAELEAIPVATPLRRAGRDSLARNAAIVASERGGAAEVDALRALASDESRPEWLRAMASGIADRLPNK